MWLELFKASLWIGIFSGSTVLATWLFKITADLILAENNKVSISGKKIIKIFIFIFFACILIAPISFYISFKSGGIRPENIIQNSKSNNFIKAIAENDNSKTIVIEWMPTISKACQENSKPIDQSNCINLAFETNEKINSEAGTKKIIDIAKNIDLTKYKDLNGVYLSITPLARKAKCENSLMTPYDIRVRRCFIEYKPTLFLIGG